MPKPRSDEKRYAPDQLAIFAAHVADRADARPIYCDSGDVCWVRDGPPSLSGGGLPKYMGCHGAPRVRSIDGLRSFNGRVKVS